jgi:phosphate transport system protein
MSRYEERLTADKTAIRERVVAIGGTVERAVSDAVAALVARDRAAAYRIVLGDLPINREIREIDRLCHAFVARHLPSAGHLRFVSSVLQMNVALERVGDYAVTIAREAVQLAQDPPEELARELTALGSEVCNILRQAMHAFAKQDAELARKARPLAHQVDARYGKTLTEVLTKGIDRSLPDTFALLTVFSKLERVSDQAKNISEETLFEITGETKPPKRYKILFVDDDCTRLAPLAVALAKKAFPESGEYAAAGHAPGAKLAPALEAVAEKLALDLGGLAPRPLDARHVAIEGYHVVVCLTAEAEAQFKVVPYSTALLRWAALSPSAAQEDAASADDLEAVARVLAGEIRDLMTTMRGAGAD